MFILNSKKVEIEANRFRLASFYLKWNLELTPEAPLPGSEEEEETAQYAPTTSNEGGSLFSGLTTNELEYQDVELSEDSEANEDNEEKTEAVPVPDEKEAEEKIEEQSEPAAVKEDPKEAALKLKEAKEQELQDIIVSVQNLEEKMLSLVEKGDDLDDEALEQCGTYFSARNLEPC